MFLIFFWKFIFFFFLLFFIIFLLFYFPSGIKTIYFSPFYRYLCFLFLANISPSRIFFCPIFFILLPTKFSILFIYFFSSSKTSAVGNSGPTLVFDIIL